MTRLEWHKLNPEDRQRWEVLGWSEYRWDEGAPIPDSTYKDFKDLSPREQTAARGLGYTQAS